MKTIETKVYTLDELSDDAKDKARDWAREFVCDYDWWDHIYYDAKTIGLEITSFGLDRNRHAEGKLTQSTVETAQAILKEHGKATSTATLAAKFLTEWKDAKDDDTREELCEEFERDLLEEYSIILQKEYEYMNENEYIDDMITANEYTFTESGKRFG
jgi:hypothetical protein